MELFKASREGAVCEVASEFVRHASLSRAWRIEKGSKFPRGADHPEGASLTKKLLLQRSVFAGEAAAREMKNLRDRNCLRHEDR
tara:strand:+ start:307 stop:558 length:252 start_codon:yes stop_codon:yes gene_type:complete